MNEIKFIRDALFRGALFCFLWIDNCISYKDFIKTGIFFIYLGRRKTLLEKEKEVVLNYLGRREESNLLYQIIKDKQEKVDITYRGFMY
jgi:hypothetical protein